MWSTNDFNEYVKKYSRIIDFLTVLKQHFFVND